MILRHCNFHSRYYKSLLTLHIFLLSRIIVEGAGEDYTVPSVFRVEFNSTDQACAPVTILQDLAVEGNHEFTISISDVGEFAMTGSPIDTVITIIDDDGKNLIKH